ncbi:MAG: electron transfer flavoprotein subunit beta/FixA family protein [Candidatus Omnitrophota bacterium]|nr:electron transfer flavoprotein subunit beta/FixA family protein [Candidatus Omnitrophota bacterium]
MKIIICIKQVPETIDVRIDPETNTLIREGVQSIINPFDMYAIEEALRIKEHMGAEVIVISMGPSQAESALREAVGLGADRAVLLSDRAFAGADTLATSYTLAQAIRKLGDFSLIICGKQASDGDTAQVGPGISVHLNIPQITYVKKIEKITKDFIRAQRMTEQGFEIIKAPLPCLLTVVKEINEPRISSLKGMLRAKKAEITKWSIKDLDLSPARLGLNGSPTQVIKIFTPSPRKGGEIFTGDFHEAVDKLVEAVKKDISICHPAA